MGKSPKAKPPQPDPLPPLIDAHTHLDSAGARSDADITAMVDRAEAAGVGKLITVACDLEQARFSVRAANRDPRIYAAVALHPTESGALFTERDGLEISPDVADELSALAADPRVVAIGETGLDYYWLAQREAGRREDVATAEQQHAAFGWHIDLAKRLGKPLMIHNRDADADLVADLDRFGAPETVVFHCFSSDAAMARLLVDRGYILSFSGTVTFKNSLALQEAARLVPHGQLVVETDAPYLTPHPFRGSPNEPYAVAYTARFLAELRGEDPEEFALATTATATRVFGL